MGQSQAFAFMIVPRLAPSLALISSVLLFVDAASRNNGGFNHRAHAVPGGPYEEQDKDSNGLAWVNLNGELSHSHFFNPKTGATGKIVKYKWTVGKKVICKEKFCSLRFPVGKTIVNLEVVDSTGDVASSTTVVNVYRGANPAIRLWYYPGNGRIPDQHTPKVMPSFSQTIPRINLASAKAFPKFVKEGKFSIRVLGNIKISTQGYYRFRVGCRGASCTLWIGNILVVTGKDRNLDSKQLMFSKSMHKIHAVFRRRDSTSRAPKFTLSWMTPGSNGWKLVPGKYLSHNPSVYAPVVHSVKPPNAAVGSVITITGSSLKNARKVRIGSLNCVHPVAKNQFTIICVVPGGRGMRMLSVQTGKGVSNAISFEILVSQTATGLGNGRGPIGYYQPIKFRNAFWKKGTKLFRLSQPTAVTLGPDNKYYIGSLAGFVHVVETNLGNQVTGYCRSTNVGKSRSILGVAFNPAEKGILRLYASTSVLHWVKKSLRYREGWRNGEIITMRGTRTVCLTKVATVISGLPVSNYDHSVNGITFDHDGNLLVTIGGSTNAGVSETGDLLGGVPDSPFSGSMAVAPILRKSFDGRIKYSQYNRPESANKISGKVSVYASGLRNSLCHVAHSNGHIYATDNGANENFGSRSTGCNSSGEIVTEPDTLKKLKRGGFYGYANRNRGRLDRRQCIHRSPGSTTKGYDKAIATLESSTNGIIEYTANTFGAQMRGDLLLSKFTVSGNGKVFRVQLKKNGNVKSKFELSKFSGITAAMSPTGGLVMPRVYQSKIAVLMPVEKNPGRIVVTSVNPFRGPKRGGGRITITGWNLHAPLSVTVGGRKCKNVGNYKNGRSLTCVVPSGSGKAAVVVTRFGKKSKSFGFEYLYMNI